LLTLPTKGFSWHLIFTIGTGVIFALPAMYWIWKGITGKAEDIANNFWKVALTLGLTITFMGSGRHIYRATALAPHKKLVEAKTIAYQEVKKRRKK
jgi:cytochrome c